MRFAKPVYVGEPPSNDHPLTVNSGTVSLLDLGYGPLAVTCFHVIEAYRDKLKQSSRCVFMIASCPLDPIAQLVGENRALDLAIIRITYEQAHEITKKNIGIGEHFYPSDLGLRELDRFVMIDQALQQFIVLEQILRSVVLNPIWSIGHDFHPTDKCLQNDYRRVSRYVRIDDGRNALRRSKRYGARFR